MIVSFAQYCDRCRKRMDNATGAEVYKHTVGNKCHPTRHLCERCYAEVFEKQIKLERENAIHK